MTAPASSWPLAEHGDFPDIEALGMDLLSSIEIGGTPIRVGTWIPDDVEMPYIHVYRALSVGGMNPGGWEDISTIYVGTWAASRLESRQLLREVRRVLGAFAHGGGHKSVLVDYALEATAPGNAPEDDPDERRVDSSWTFACRRHRGATIYL